MNYLLKHVHRKGKDKQSYICTVEIDVDFLHTDFCEYGEDGFIDMDKTLPMIEKYIRTWLDNSLIVSCERGNSENKNNIVCFFFFNN